MKQTNPNCKAPYPQTVLVKVHFYRAGTLRGNPLCSTGWTDWWRHIVLAIAYRRFVHCEIEVNGVRYGMTRKGIATWTPGPDDPKPDMTLGVSRPYSVWLDTLGQFDHQWRGRRSEWLWSAVRWIGFDVEPVNCITVSALLVGFHNAPRSPYQLFRWIKAGSR